MSADHQDDFHLYVLGALGVIPPRPVSDATIQRVMRRGEPPSGFDELVAAGYGGMMTPMNSTLADEVAVSRTHTFYRAATHRTTGYP